MRCGGRDDVMRIVVNDFHSASRVSGAMHPPQIFHDSAVLIHQGILNGHVDITNEVSG